jgi:dihydroorotate dehydrogenase electron transfer subunit
MIYNVIAPVFSINTAAHGSIFITLKAPAIAKSARPGQFVYVKPCGAKEPLLRSAFSVMDANRVSGRISLYVDVKGPGTEALAALRKNDRVSLLGPLGTGFDPKSYRKTNVLIGGGCGSAPLFFLARDLRKRGKRVVFYYGARTKAQLAFAALLKSVCHETIVVTDDGSAGKKGLVTEYLDFSPEHAVFACGPKPMLNAVAALAPHACVAMETEMACGVGVCMGCAVAMKDGTYKRCCTEGPVFRAKDVAWN